MRKLFGRAVIATMLVVSSASVTAAPAKSPKPTKPVQPPRPTPPANPTTGSTYVNCMNSGGGEQFCAANYPG